MFSAGRFSRLLAVALVVGSASTALAAEEGAWSVSKTSGEVWMTTTGAQPVSLGKEEVLKPGDSIRTGRNGRVLLVRGEETIMVSPNSVIGLPTEKKEGLSTTIVQQAGSILLEVEKRNVKHFEVETPYLAAVVKGTQFRVTVNATSTSVDVVKGQVQVADFKSGQIAQVMPGQHATAFAQGSSGLTLGGSGTFAPIEHGQPRAPSIDRVPVPKSGLMAPRHAGNGAAIRTLAHGNAVVRAVGQRNAMTSAGRGGSAALQSRNAVSAPRHGVTRISSALGEVKLNFHRVTNGLARGTAPAHGGTRNVASRDTVWGSGNSAATAVASSSGNSNDAGNGNGNGNAGANAAAASGGAGAVAAAASPGGGNGNGNNGNGNGNGGGNGNGNNGNGNGNGGGNGNGNNGNGNGNGGGANGGGNGSNGNGHGKVK